MLPGRCSTARFALECAPVRAALEQAVFTELADATVLAAEEKDHAGHMSEIKAQSMDESLQLITLAYYGCVKIKTTPLPFSYNLHLKTLLMVYLVSQPALRFQPLALPDNITGRN